jgi:3-hydroxy-5-methyl-1-naphthoate 3-O-methyltransferase
MSTHAVDDRQAIDHASAEPTPIPLMQIITGFWAAKTLAAAVELDLFTTLAGTGTDAQELTQGLGLPARPAEMLLSACAALGLLEKREGRYYNSRLSDAFLVRGQPYYFGGFITMVDRRLYLPWNQLTEALKTDRAQTWGGHPGLFEVLAANPEGQRLFTEAMHSIGVQSGKAVAQAVDFSPYRALLDVGGGSGAYAIEAVRRYPHLQAVVFDLPAALEIAREKIAEAGYAGRIRTYAGDFFTEEMPQEADVMLLSMILHDWTPEKNRAILQKCFRALPSGGVVIISELMMDDDKTGPLPAALMSLTMLIETEGRNYTWAEYTTWLEDVGFREMQRIPIASPGANGILVGHKP